MSASSTQVYPCVANSWISAIASCARRFGRNPYEHGWKSASKMGFHAPNTVGNFCFEVTLGYRRVERGR